MDARVYVPVREDGILITDVKKSMLEVCLLTRVKSLRLQSFKEYCDSAGNGCAPCAGSTYSISEGLPITPSLLTNFYHDLQRKLVRFLQ